MTRAERARISAKDTRSDTKAKMQSLLAQASPQTFNFLNVYYRVLPKMLFNLGNHSHQSRRWKAQWKARYLCSSTGLDLENVVSTGARGEQSIGTGPSSSLSESSKTIVLVSTAGGVLAAGGVSHLLDDSMGSALPFTSAEPALYAL